MRSSSPPPRKEDWPVHSMPQNHLDPGHSTTYSGHSLESFPLAADELKRVWESVLSQVNWTQVEEYVASNRRGSTFHAAVDLVMKAKIDDLFRAEEQ